MNTVLWRVSGIDFFELVLADVLLLFSIGALMLLVAVEVSAPNYGLIGLRINPEKLRNATLLSCVIFLIIVGIQVFIS